MLPGMKKFLATASSAYPQLAAILHDEKLVSQTVQNLTDAETKASATNREWAKSEKDKRLIDMFTSLEEANGLNNKLYSNFLERTSVIRTQATPVTSEDILSRENPLVNFHVLLAQHNQYRKVFKDILQDKLMLDDMKKQSDRLDSTVVKMFKSYASVQKKKNDPCLTSMAHEDLKKALKAKEDFHVALENRLDEIQFQTLQRVRHNLLDLIDASADLHRKMLMSLEEQRKIITLYMPDENLAEYPNLTKAQISADKIISSLMDKMRVPRPLSRSDIYAGMSFQAFRYLPAKDVILSAYASPDRDGVDGGRQRSNTVDENLSGKKEARSEKLGKKELGKRLSNQGTSSPHHLKPMPPPRPAFSLTDLRDVGREVDTSRSDVYETLNATESDSDDDYQYTGPYLSLVEEEEDSITPRVASDLYEKLADWLSMQSPRNSVEDKCEPPPVPKRNNLRGRPPQPPVKPKDIHQRLEMARPRPYSTGTIDSVSPDELHDS